MQQQTFRYGIVSILFLTILIVAATNWSKTAPTQQKTSNGIILFMTGDAMLGRGIDQILQHPSNPVLYEPSIRSAIEYVKLGERKNGSIPYPVSCDYIWGDALTELDRVSPDVTIMNLETSITKSDDYWKRKSIHYRMNPDNIKCLKRAHIDYVSLANNHVLDWNYSGLNETITMLNKANILHAGAGSSEQQASKPAIVQIPNKGRVIIFSYGDTSSGIPIRWAATKDTAGINLLNDFSDKTVERIKQQVAQFKQKNDIVIASIHWGQNWGYQIEPAHSHFAHQLIDEAGVDVIHGHSSHHAKGIEVYNDKLIIYGSGDFLNDYEGIKNIHESFRSDLSLMFFANIEPSSGNLITLQITPMQIKHFKINNASNDDAVWLHTILNRESASFGHQFMLSNDNVLTLQSPNSRINHDD